jgi:hypothetical protein
MPYAARQRSPARMAPERDQPEGESMHTIAGASASVTVTASATDSRSRTQTIARPGSSATRSSPLRGSATSIPTAAALTRRSGR